MPIDPKTGGEVACHLVRLSTGSSEYKTVSSAFESTIGTPSPGKFISVPYKETPYQGILKIERIQNPKLYRQYMGAKKMMDKVNPPSCVNERKLYHGCPPDCYSKIYTQGFNRSFGFGPESGELSCVFQHC